MLQDLEIHAALPVQDMARAKRYYSEQLGLTPFEESPGAIDYKCKDSWFSLFPSQGRSDGSFTQAGWRCDDIDAVVAYLRGRGVRFVEYDQPGFKTANGIADFGFLRAAWFKDSEGNMLGLAEFK